MQQLTVISIGSNRREAERPVDYLETGWKYLCLGWLLMVVVLVGSVVLSRLFANDLSQHEQTLLFRFALLLPAICLLAAIFLSLRSLLQNRSGLWLFLSAVFGSYIAFWTVMIVSALFDFSIP